MTTPALREAMRARFKLPEWVLMEEVRDAAGFEGKRAADGIAMSMWPSRGLEIYGLELKASRSDWLRELKDPAKAEAIASYCDRWFIVAAPGVVKVDDLPRTWGLMELRGGTLAAVKDAPRNENVKPLSRTFVAAMMRRCGEHDEWTLRAATEKHTAAIVERERERVDREVKRRTADLETLMGRVEKVKAATGIDLLGYGFDDSGLVAALKFALKAVDLNDRYYGIAAAASQLERTAESMRELAAALPSKKAEAAA